MHGRNGPRSSDDLLPRGQEWPWPGGVAEVIGPGLEADVGYHGRGASGTAAVDHLVQQTGRLARLGPLDVIEPEFVNGQEIEVAVVP